MHYSPLAAGARAAVLGAVAGLRSMTPPAVLALRSSRGRARVLPLLAAGELVADKLPGVPSRLSPPAFGFRLVTGAASGAVLASRLDNDGRFGALAGAAGAALGAYAGSFARKAVVDAGVPDAVAAFAEDALALGIAFALVPAPSVPDEIDVAGTED